MKRVPNVSEYGVVVTGDDGRVQGFQEKPDPAEALSDLANCMIYVLEPEIFDHFPDQPEVDFALDVFPALLADDSRSAFTSPTPTGTTSARWREYLQGNLDVVPGAVDVEPAGEMVDADADGEPVGVELTGPVLLGDGASSATASASTARS